MVEQPDRTAAARHAGRRTATIETRVLCCLLNDRPARAAVMYACPLPASNKAISLLDRQTARMPCDALFKFIDFYRIRQPHVRICAMRAEVDSWRERNAGGLKHLMAEALTVGGEAAAVRVHKKSARRHHWNRKPEA